MYVCMYICMYVCIINPKSKARNLQPQTQNPDTLNPKPPPKVGPSDSADQHGRRESRFQPACADRGKSLVVLDLKGET